MTYSWRRSAIFLSALLVVSASPTRRLFATDSTGQSAPLMPITPATAYRRIQARYSNEHTVNNAIRFFGIKIGACRPITYVRQPERIKILGHALTLTSGTRWQHIRELPEALAADNRVKRRTISAIVGPLNHLAVILDEPEFLWTRPIEIAESVYARLHLYYESTSKRTLQQAIAVLGRKLDVFPLESKVGRTEHLIILRNALMMPEATRTEHFAQIPQFMRDEGKARTTVDHYRRPLSRIQEELNAILPSDLVDRPAGDPPNELTQ